MSLDKHPPTTSSRPSIKRFLVSTLLSNVYLSSDILEGGQKLYIRDAKTGDVRWCKTRTLAYNEIVDELQSPKSDSTLEYSIHRPTRGWYIHVRAHSQSRHLPPMALTPDPLADPNGADADSELMIQLPITLRSKGKQKVTSLEDQDEYSFPPTPPIRSPPLTGRRALPKDISAPVSASVSPVIALLSEPTRPLHTDPLRSPEPPGTSSSTSKPAPHRPSMTTIPLIFAPVPAPVLPRKQPVFSRAYASGLLRVVTNTLLSPPRRSFVLSLRENSVPAVASGQDTLETELQVPLATQALTTPVLEAGPSRASTPGMPVLTYTDTTPIFSVSQMTGVLAIDLGALGVTGNKEVDQSESMPESESNKECVDVGLLVASAMAYLDFLGDREGYLAAANGG